MEATLPMRAAQGLDKLIQSHAAIPEGMATTILAIAKAGWTLRPQDLASSSG
jgi:hypothetical protein